MAAKQHEQNSGRNRARRKLPDFMYGDNFPSDRIGSGGATYGGAVDWLTKHKDDFEMALRYVQRYPNVVQEACMDNFWDFVEPLVYNNNLLLKYDQFLSTQFGFTDDFKLGTHFYSSLPTAAQFFQKDADTRLSDYQYPVRRVFFCCPPVEAHAALRRDVIDALLPLCCVRTNFQSNLAARVNALDICRAICGGTFVMVLCDAALEDDVCMQLLRIAVAYDSPIVMLREAGYQLPDQLPQDEIELVEPPADVPFMPQRTSLTVNAKDSHDGGSIRASRHPAAAVREKASIALVLRRSFAESVVYNPKMVDVSISLLLGRLSEVVGPSISENGRSSTADQGAAIEQPVRVGSASGPRKPLHRIGSARTTVSFERAYDSSHPSGGGSGAEPDVSR